MLTIAQLSDPHLDLSPERLNRFVATVAQVESLPRVDALVISGDLVRATRTEAPTSRRTNAAITPYSAIAIGEIFTARLSIDFRPGSRSRLENCPAAAPAPRL